MTLKKGAPLGPYCVDDRLGVGGMGEVYAATDTRLKRRVAIKVLPASLETDTQYRARFQREAELLSSLHHPHICTLHDIGQTDDGHQYLVLELLEGETLQARLRRGPLPLAQLLCIASQMADALDAAHRHGIVHRDLKPGNVMLTPQGAKLLDFGLAKPFVATSASAETVVGDVPAAGTGTLTGTLHYMAPEQVAGGTADARTDIFAFGAVLHEMATAEQAFAGASTASVIAKILEHDPPPLSKKLPHTPPVLDDLVATCLAKDPEDRWQSAHDIQLQLEGLRRQGASGATSRTDASARSPWRWLPWAVAAVAVAIAVTLLMAPRRPAMEAAPRLHVEVPLEDATLQEFDVPELSPDGRRLTYSALKDGRRHLFVRDLEGDSTRLVPGTAGATFPFWAPDGQTVGFFADGSLKRLALTGSVPQVLAPAPFGIGGVWGPGFILYSPSRTSLHRVSDSGGIAERLEVTAEDGGQAMRYEVLTPWLLPDGDRFLATVLSDRGLYIGSLARRTVRKLQNGGFWPRVAAGHLVYSHARQLMARPFDVDRGRITGVERVLADSAGPMSVLDTGTVAFADPPPLRRLTWVDRRGYVEGNVGETADYIGVSLSARGGRAALWVQDEAANMDVWDLDIESGILSRLTSDPSRDSSAAWSPDERQLAFTSNRTGRPSIFLKSLATREEVLLHEGTEGMVVDGWTPDGTAVVARTLGRAVFVLPTAGDRRPRMVADTPYVEDELHVSPDGRWVAFNSDESGAWEVYAARFPSFTDKRQLSRGGGVQPLWRGDGRELFYLGMDSSMMSIALSGGPTLRPSPAVRLFGANVEANAAQPQYAVTPDGQRFLLLDHGPRRPRMIHLLLNWLRPTE